MHLRSYSKGLIAALALAGLLGHDAPAQAQDVPRTGYYLIRQYTSSARITQQRGLGPAPYSVSASMLLRADGTYEVYWYPSREFRGRGTYAFNPADNTFRWHSGLNHEMGRRGTYVTDAGICNPCIQFGPTTFAVPAE